MELLAPYGSYARRHQSEDTIGLLRDRMVARTRSNFEVVCISRVGLIDLHRGARLNNREISTPDAASAKSKKFTPSIETRNVMLAGVHSAGAITIVTASDVRSCGVETASPAGIVTVDSMITSRVAASAPRPQLTTADVRQGKNRDLPSRDHRAAVTRC